MLEKVSKILMTLGILVGIVVILVATSYLQGKYSDSSDDVTLQKDNVVYLAGYKPILIVSGSMLPSIQINSINIVKQCNIEDVKVGDTVMYVRENDGRLITHRAIEQLIDEKGNLNFVVKGDNNDLADNLYVTKDNISGKIICTMNWTAPIISRILEDNKNIDMSAIIKICISIIVIITIFVMIISKIVYYLIVLGMTLFTNKKAETNWKTELVDKVGKESYSIMENFVALGEEENDYEFKSFIDKFKHNLYFLEIKKCTKNQKAIAKATKYWTKKIKKENKK